ncbi:hypothetical protein [Williamsia herbipolensis]|uniref:hypothetical protein n=1 Tax=Williamsia herbipolensis TaxID=1603258 RepID=UPI0005F7E7F0|nr:hypothetical protein [Williamsia herbipolensis]
MTMRSTITNIADSITVNPTAPPGSDKLLTVVSWAGWLAMIAAVVALVAAGAKFGFEKSHGTADNAAATKVAWTLVGCVVIATAGGLVGALV